MCTALRKKPAQLWVAETSSCNGVFGNSVALQRRCLCLCQYLDVQSEPARHMPMRLDRLATYWRTNYRLYDALGYAVDRPCQSVHSLLITVSGFKVAMRFPA
jgi:hypothetical protein